MAMAAEPVATRCCWQTVHSALLLLLLSQACGFSGGAATFCAGGLTVQSWEGTALGLPLRIFAVASGGYHAVAECFVGETPQATFLGTSVLTVWYSCKGLGD